MSEAKFHLWMARIFFVLLYILIAIQCYSPIKSSIMGGRRGQWTNADRAIAVTFAVMWPVGMPTVWITDWLIEQQETPAEW